MIVKSSALVQARVGLTYSASITPNAASGNFQTIRANDANAFTINAPLNPREGQRLSITIANISGGALGAISWDAVFKKLAFTSPTNGNNCTIVFFYDGTNWMQEGPQSLQVPN